MTFSLTILGSSSALPTSKRFTSAHLLNVNERIFLIDCGEGTQVQLRRFKAPFSKIHRIFISHMHGDHIFGLFGLFSSFQLLGRKSDLHIYGPGELRDYVGFYLSNFGHDQDYQIIVHPVGHRRTSIVFEDESIEVSSIPLKHRIPVTGYFFREKPPEPNITREALQEFNPSISQILAVKNGSDLIFDDGRIIPNKEVTYPPWKQRSYAYISDTAFKPDIVDVLKNTDLLYHEATFSDDDALLAKKTFHSTSSEAATIALAANAGKLLLGHFSSRYKSLDKILEDARKIFPQSFVVNDGDYYTVERQRKERE